MKKTKKEESKLFTTLRLIKNVFFAVILVTLTGVIVLSLVTRFSGKTPSMFGYTMYRVSSGSMKPTLQVGDIILCEDCDPLKLKNGDIITYNGISGQFEGKRVTHRVFKQPYKVDGNYYLVTKGDDNPLEDTPIPVSCVSGKYLYKLDIIRGFYEFFLTPWGLLAMIALIILAFFNELIIFVKALFGKGFEQPEKVSIEDIIERYQKENIEKENADKTESSVKRRLRLMNVGFYKENLSQKRFKKASE